MGLQLVTPPGVEPVSLDESKAHLHLDNDAEDEFVTNCTVAARGILESWRYPGVGRLLITQTWNYIIDSFPPTAMQWIEVPICPVQQVISITYIDWLGNVNTMPSNQYLVDIYPPLGPGTGPTRIMPVAPGTYLGTWPSVTLQPINAVTIQVKAGFGDDGSKVPESLKVAQKMLVGSLFENREATGDSQDVSRPPKVPIMVPFGYDMLTAVFRGAGVA